MTEEKLKTLKDFDFLTGVQQKLSKEKIIKQIKEIDRPRETTELFGLKVCDEFIPFRTTMPPETSDAVLLIKVLMFIFNITEEDLKQGD